MITLKENLSVYIFLVCVKPFPLIVDSIIGPIIISSTINSNMIPFDSCVLYLSGAQSTLVIENDW